MSAAAPSETGLRLRVEGAWRGLERLLDRAFGAEANPLRHLGALGFFFFWCAATSGIYLYVAYDTSAAGAWRSVDAITRGDWPAGGLARSLHRYSADAFVAVMLLHIVRELLAGHYRGFRWFSWISGVPPLVLAYASGIGGFWLAWDDLAQFSAVATAEWLDALQLSADPFVRNFLTAQAVDDRLFSLFMFLHIGLPLALLATMWVHVQRVSHAETLPRRALAAGAGLMLLGMALAAPVAIRPEAVVTQMPQSLPLDWLLLFPHALMYATSPGTLWAIVLGTLALLLVAPILARGKAGQVVAPAQAAARTRSALLTTVTEAARIDPSNCNGCGRCLADCPFGAVTLSPRTDDRRAPRIAEVAPDLCAACGICAGACPSSTPFRSAEDFTSGIDLPQFRVATLRAALDEALAAPRGAGSRVVLFGCARAAEVARLGDQDTIALDLICTGMLPPSLIEYALRSGADGVLVTGCRQGECEFRLGNQWVEERLAGSREPHLRASVPPERVRIAWAARDEGPRLASELASFRSTLAALGPMRARAGARKEKAHV